MKSNDVRIDKSKLHPRLRYYLDKLLKEAVTNDIGLIITEGYRTKAYQDELYAKGRTAPGNIVTNAKGSSYSSQHQWGIAFDIAINDKDLYNIEKIKKVAKMAKSIGLSWGGDWKSFQDNPHFYLNDWGDTTTRLKSKYGTPDAFKKDWKKKTTREIRLFSNKLMTTVKCWIPEITTVYIIKEGKTFTLVEYEGKTGYVKTKFLK